jgi:hypothetical protein
MNHRLFHTDDVGEVGLTFDDALLVLEYSDLMSRMMRTLARLSRR